MTDLINIRDSDRGRPISDLTGHVIYGEIDSDVKKVIQTLSSIEREVSAKDGTTFMMRIRPYRSIDNVIDGVVMTFIDITGRRRSGAASHQLGLIIEDSFSEVYVCDGETLRFSNVNAVARERLGYTMDELRRLSLTEIEHPASRSVYQANIERLRSGKRQRVSFKTSHRRKDGSPYPVEVNLVRIAEPPLIVAYARDKAGRE
jgi:two-component system, chemotaxis family, CheB/CheR fusion protein